MIRLLLFILHTTTLINASWLTRAPSAGYLSLEMENPDEEGNFRSFGVIEVWVMEIFCVTYRRACARGSMRNRLLVTPAIPKSAPHFPVLRKLSQYSNVYTITKWISSLSPEKFPIALRPLQMTSGCNWPLNIFSEYLPSRLRDFQKFPISETETRKTVVRLQYDFFSAPMIFSRALLILCNHVRPSRVNVNWRFAFFLIVIRYVLHATYSIAYRFTVWPPIMIARTGMS